MLPEGVVVQDVSAESLAANNSKIVMSGECNLEFLLGGSVHVLNVWISEDVDEFLLGYDWFQQANCQWDFSQQELTVNGEKIPLYIRSMEEQCRIVFCAENVNIPAATQMVIPVRSRARHLKDAESESDWIVD